MWEDKTDCMEIKGFVQLDSLKPPDVGITDRLYVNEDNYVLYWEWEKTKFLKIPKYWKGSRGKNHKIKVDSKCGKSLVKQINIEK